MHRKTFAEINIENLKHNYKVLKGLLPKSSFFCPMIKSSAYGHGDLRVAKALFEEGETQLGVALVEEGVKLRQQGLTEGSLLVYGPFAQDALADVFEYKLTPVVSVMDQIEILAESKKPIQIHIKFNTGMNRLGFDNSDVERLLTILKNNQQIKVVGLCSHLANAADFLSEDSYSQYQIGKLKDFEKLFDLQSHQIHMLNSESLIANFLRPQGTWGARPGIALYGVKPQLENLTSSENEAWQAIKLKPVMTLMSEIVSYHQLKKGEKVSYGGRWVAPRDTVIGVIPMGYADGLQRHFSNKGVVMFRGQKVPIVGTVCMDYTMIDLTEVINTQPGKWKEEVMLFGEKDKLNLPVEEVAELASTISYELLTGIGKRVPRKYI